jgi:hypothetical protein
VRLAMRENVTHGQTVDPPPWRMLCTPVRFANDGDVAPELPAMGASRGSWTALPTQSADGPDVLRWLAYRCGRMCDDVACLDAISAEAKGGQNVRTDDHAWSHFGAIDMPAGHHRCRNLHVRRCCPRVLQGSDRGCASASRDHAAARSIRQRHAGRGRSGRALSAGDEGGACADEVMNKGQCAGRRRTTIPDDDWMTRLRRI